MELSEFQLLFTATHTLLAGESATDGASHTSPDPAHLEAVLSGLLSDAPWAPVFFILCTAVLATVPAPSFCSSRFPIPRDSALWMCLNKPVGVLSPMMEVRRWVKRCRISYPAFVYLMEELRPYLAVEPLEVELVLNRLASGAPAAAVGELWGVGVSAVTEYTNVMTSVFASYENLFSKYVVAPTGEGLQRITRGFYEGLGVLNIGGAIGGTRFVLQDRPERGCESRSVFLQGVCDADKVFWDVCCGAAGGLNDEELLKSSSLWTRLSGKKVLREPDIIMQGKPIRPFLVGSRNYPLLPFLMKPFDAGRAGTEAEALFDAQLQKGLASIVAAFGILENRWRILKNFNVPQQRAFQTIVACCVLHNFCQLSNQSEPRFQMDDGPSHNFPDRRCEDVLGEETRRVLFLD